MIMNPIKDVKAIEGCIRVRVTTMANTRIMELVVWSNGSKAIPMILDPFSTPPCKTASLIAPNGRSRELMSSNGKTRDPFVFLLEVFTKTSDALVSIVRSEPFSSPLSSSRSSSFVGF